MLKNTYKQILRHFFSFFFISFSSVNSILILHHIAHSCKVTLEENKVEYSWLLPFLGKQERDAPPMGSLMLFLKFFTPGTIIIYFSA